MPERARTCQNVLECAQSVPECAQNVPEHARMCQNVLECARTCQNVPRMLSQQLAPHLAIVPEDHPGGPRIPDY